MKTVSHGMDVAKQRRKFIQRIVDAPDVGGLGPNPHVQYLEYLLSLFDASVAAGQPRPASEWLPWYEEEFDA
ncbi:hypothetical protein Hosp_072 [Mycobacterium phage Hosp]|jgi:hypothetical protein|uniref:hypothetical protein n=1 Tax=Mycobacterium phage Hosp TaxID=1463811 RepID=UPI00042F15AD|nr:hypothetical protein FH38_gp72 [Mycobacterium phage Hosp]AHK12026.1 hypothetical protein Hosp_072 [Mycobacterium phage Hosp]